jgi:hypothetical protein
MLNDQPAILIHRDGRPFTVITIAAIDDAIRAIFMQADVGRLRHVGGSRGRPPR